MGALSIIDYPAIQQPESLGTALDKSIDSITTYPGGCTMTVIDLSGGAVTVQAGPALLLGWSVDVALNAYAVTISDGVTVKRTLPASMPVGDRIFPAATFSTSIVVAPNALSTGTLVLYTRAL